MPLLKRKPFTPENPPADLKPSDEVFVCVHTNEVFTDYESFFKRTILCNSLVWSCKFTGKSNLTYSEALKSERQVIKQGNSLSSPLQRATLTLVHNIQRGRLANLCDEVFSYLKDRYQEGEDVEVQHSGKRRKGKVQKVIEHEELPNGVEKVTSPNSRKHGLSSGKDKKTEKSTSTPGKIRKGSDGGGKSRKSSESSLASPGKSKSAPEFLEIPDTPEKGSLGSVSPKSPKKLLTPKQKHFSTNDKQTISSPTSKSSNELDEDDDVMIIEDSNTNSETKQKEESLLKSPKNKNAEFWPDPKTYKYAVQLYHDKSSKKKDAKEVVIVDFNHICRKKGSFTRDKLKNFLKLSCERSSQNSEGFYYVIAEYRKKFDLEEPSFEIQLDSPPKKSKKRKSSQHDDGGETSSGKKKKAKTDGKSSKDDTKSKKKKINGAQSKKLTHEQKLQLIEEEREKRRKAIEEDKEKRKIQKEQEKIVNQKRREEQKERRKVEKEQLREQKRQEAIQLKEWSRPREDLELDDLKDLPEPQPVQVKIANELFGDAVMVVEFLYVFGSLFDMKDEFPSSLSFSMLEEALAETDPEGVYYDLLQFLLGAILRTHMDEEEEEGLENSHNPLDLDDEDNHTAKVSASAAMAAVWPMLHQGKPLHELIMDPYTCTELLRLHLLSSGARVGCGDAEYRWQSRGGFTYADDVGVEFRHREPGIMKYLMTGSVYDLSADEKLKILSALCGQLMTYATSREFVEDGFDKLKKARREWISDQWAEQRREKEEAAARYRKRQEERMKLKEEIERKKKEKENEKNQEDGKDGKQNSKDSSVQEEAKQETTKESKKGKGKKKGNKETEKVSEDKGKDVNKSNEKPVEDDKTKQDEPAVLTKEEEEQIALQKKVDRERREQEYLEETRKAVAMSSIQPLGRDRIYRRYWSFRSVKGLYVEEDDPDLPLFLETIFEEEENCEDDGEKDIEGDGKKSEVDEKKLKETRIKQLKRAEIIDKYGARDGRMRWSFIAEQQDFDGLINALNPRGYRERMLREALQSDYRYLTKTIEKCPFREDFVPQKKIPKSRPRKQQTIDRSHYKITEEFLEANLRDQILDLEDRIWQGGLGSTKVEDRIAWRVKVENGIYSHLKDNMVEIKTENGNNDVEMKDEKDESLLNGNFESPQPMNIEKELKHDLVDVKNENAEDSKVVSNGDSKDEENDPELTKVEDQKESRFSSIPSHLKLNLNQPSGSPDQSRTGTPVISLAPTSMPVNPAVKELALALLKVEQGIESKYLSLPLGEDEETKRQRQKDAAALALAEFNEMMQTTDESKKKKSKKTDKDVDSKTKDDKDVDEKKEDDDDNSSNSSTQDIPSKQKTCLERWEESLTACSSLSQVFVHLNTLDGSITWSKSILNARCRLCRRKGDGEKMLLCDACDRGHHMYCLKPPIKEIPEGNWFCPDCRPKEPRRSERRRRTPAKDDYEEEEEEDDSEDEEESEEESEFEENSDDASDAGSEHVDLCALCEEDGELLCCDVCPLAYHMECAYPPLRRIPRGSWACQVCTGADDERPKKRRVKKSTIKAALNNVKEKEKQKNSKKSSTAKSKSKKRVQKDSNTSSSKRQRTRESSPTSSISSVPASSRRKRHLPTSLRLNGRSSVDSSRSPSPVRSKRDPRLTGRMIKCGKLVDEVMQHVDAEFFLDPISLAKYPNYNGSPIDLGTIKTNIQENAYNTVDDFISDVRKVFIDCAEHFRPRAKEARAGVRLSAFFETRLSEMSLDVSQRAVRSTRRT